MNKIGVIAVEEERVCPLKWHNFAKYKFVERLYMEKYNAEAVVFYVGRDPGKIAPLIPQCGVGAVMLTERFRQRFGDVLFEDVKNADGKSVYQRLVPRIIKKAIKIAGIDVGKGRVAITGENTRTALALAEALCRDFRYMTIIASNGNRADEISERILDDYGLPIIIAGKNSRVKCDVAVKTGGEMPNLPKNTILIDASGEHNISRKNSIDWVEAAVFHKLPHKIDSLSFIEAVELATGKSIACKISAFMCSGAVVPPSKLKLGG